MRILLSNDDGYQSPGIQILFERLSRQHEVTIVAPDQDRSGASNSLTLDQPLRVHERRKHVYSVTGTPTDSVHLAITGLLAEEPDIVISGINMGPNLGDDVLYSGTVAAAMEGRFLGYPAIAVSSLAFTPHYLDTAAQLVENLLVKVVQQTPADSMIFNLNIPDVPSVSLEQLVVTRLGSRHKAEPVVKTEDPRGEPIYWVGPPGAQQDAGPGTDFYAVQQQQPSLTPLHFDLTHHAVMSRISTWLAQS